MVRLIILLSFVEKNYVHFLDHVAPESAFNLNTEECGVLTATELLEQFFILCKGATEYIVSKELV